MSYPAGRRRLGDRPGISRVARAAGAKGKALDGISLIIAAAGLRPIITPRPRRAPGRYRGKARFRDRGDLRAKRKSAGRAGGFRRGERRGGRAATLPSCVRGAMPWRTRAETGSRCLRPCARDDNVSPTTSAGGLGSRPAPRTRRPRRRDGEFRPTRIGSSGGSRAADGSLGPRRGDHRFEVFEQAIDFQPDGWPVVTPARKHAAGLQHACHFRPEAGRSNQCNAWATAIRSTEPDARPESSAGAAR